MTMHGEDASPEEVAQVRAIIQQFLDETPNAVCFFCYLPLPRETVGIGVTAHPMDNTRLIFFHAECFHAVTKRAEETATTCFYCHLPLPPENDPAFDTDVGMMVDMGHLVHAHMRCVPEEVKAKAREEEQRERDEAHAEALKEHEARGR